MAESSWSCCVLVFSRPLQQIYKDQQYKNCLDLKNYNNVTADLVLNQSDSFQVRKSDENHLAISFR